MIETTWTQFALAMLRASNSPYLPFAHDGLEWQFQPTKDDDDLNRWAGSGQPPFKHRIPANGDLLPVPADGPIPFDPHLISLLGSSWWNWRDKVTEGCAIDFDFGHGGKALDEAGIMRVDEWARGLPYVQNATSKGAKGRHWLIRLENPLPAKIREEHSRNCAAIVEKVSADLGLNIRDYCCTFGQIQYIWAAKAAEAGLTLVKPATSKLQLTIQPEAKTEPKQPKRVKLGPAHKKHIKHLGEKAEWDEHAHLLNTHTFAVAEMSKPST